MNYTKIRIDVSLSDGVVVSYEADSSAETGMQSTNRAINFLRALQHLKGYSAKPVAPTRREKAPLSQVAALDAKNIELDDLNEELELANEMLSAGRGGLDIEKPRTQILRVEGTDFTRSGPGSGAVGLLPHNPLFQNYAVEVTGANPETVMDSLAYAVDYANSMVTSQDAVARAGEIDAMVKAFNAWKLIKGYRD